MAKQRTADADKTDNAAGDTQPVRSPKVFAAPCPKGTERHRTRVYKTDGRTRYCVCDDCGHTWKQAGETADPLREYVRELIGVLAAAQPVPAPDGKGDVVLIEPATIREITGKLQELL